MNIKYRKIKANGGARCWGGQLCPGRDSSVSVWNDRQIKRGQYAIETHCDGFVCNHCAPRYINKCFEQLIKISKSIIAEGDGEMTDTIIFNLGVVEKIIGEKDDCL